MIARLKFQGKTIEIPDVQKAEGWKKFSGLMFKSRNTNALLFEFSKLGKYAIHSLFCKDFLAIWLNDNKIVDYRLVTRWQFLIKPKKEFTKLLEIPVNNKYSEAISFFIEGKL